MRGRPRSEPTELTRLKREQNRKLVEIARRRGVTVREALDQIAGQDIDRVHAVECAQPADADLGGEA